MGTWEHGNMGQCQGTVLTLLVPAWEKEHGTKFGLMQNREDLPLCLGTGTT